MHEARNQQCARDAETLGDGVEPGLAVEVHVLAGVKDVEAANPERDRGAEDQHARSSEPATAIHAAAGEIPRQKPSTRWDHKVKRLV